MDRMSTCSEGGKAPWPTGTRSILQTREAMFQKAVAPLANGMAVTIQFGRDLEVGWVIVVSRTQDQPTTKDQGLGRGPGAEQGFQAFPCLRCQNHRTCDRHWQASLLRGKEHP